MSDLLRLALDAHGGLDTWNKLRSIRIAVSITGPLCIQKAQGDALNDVIMIADTQRERLVTEFPGRNKRTVFEPGRVVVETLGGNLIDARDNPFASFKSHTIATPWDNIDVAHFSSAALWSYLTIPFLYTYEGFVSQEISAIQEEGETWRRLWVTFPNHVSSHTRHQVSCFGPDGLLRRQDYTVDLLRGATALNYASRYRASAGIVVPTKRRVYSYEGDYRIVPAPPIVSIDITEVIVS